MKSRNYEQGYTLIELMISISIAVIILSTIFAVNQSLIRNWQYNKRQLSLQQELRVSMNIVVNYLQSALILKELEDKSISNSGRITYKKFSCLDQKAEEIAIYYKQDLGLCLDSNLNIISNRISDFKLQLLDDNLLLIELTIKDKGQKSKLKTGVLISSKQL